MTIRNPSLLFLSSAMILGACSQNQGGFDSGIDGAVDAITHDASDASDAHDASQAPLVSISISPENPTIVVQNGQPATQAFTAMGTRADGTTTELPGAAWVLADGRLGTISGTGVFTAAGNTAGTVMLTASLPGEGTTTLSANTTVRVQLHFDVLGGLASDTPAKFAGDGIRDSRAPRLLYPLDGSVMPSNVPAPDVQWDQDIALGQQGDLYRVRIAKTDVVLDGFVENTGDSFTYDWLTDPVGWAAVEDNDPGEAVTVTVDRYDSVGHQHVAGNPATVHLAFGQLHGAVYYSESVAGPGGHGPAIPRLARVMLDTGRHEELVPFPPNDSGSVTTQTLSRDGRYLAGALATQEGAEFDLLADLTTNPAPTVFPVGPVHLHLASFDPDGSRLVIEQLDDIGFQQGFALIDARTGALIPDTGLPHTDSTTSLFPATPAYSPDGTVIAYSDNAGYDADYNPRGDLALLPQTTGPMAFGPPMVIHHGADLSTAVEGGNADAHPTYSPDGHWIVFQHSAQNPALVDTDSPSALYLVPADGSAAPVRLDNALGGSAAADSYYPAFAPFRTAESDNGSYTWLVFYSSRDYGNDRVGTRGLARAQLWAVALRWPPVAGQDPTATPYWVPGQSTAIANLAPAWAPSACLANGGVCTALSQCCSGNCATDPQNSAQMTCQSPVGACRARGQTCGGASDCCAGLGCTNNVCDTPPPA